MVQRARELNPGIELRQGDMCSLDAESESLAGIVAFYSRNREALPRVRTR